MSACGGKTPEGNPEADSLRNVLNGQLAEMSEMDLFLDAVNASMDSMVNMDGTILRVVGENTMSRKQQIKQNIEAYKQILQRQRERLALLEEKLKNSSGQNAKLLKTIQSLKQQLAEKDQAIVELTGELEKRNFDIKTLKTHVEKLNTQVAELEEETRSQEEALVAQSDLMNEAYVFIGSKKDLKAAGLLSGGSLFKKSKLDMSKVDANAFKKVDIRKNTSFTIPAKKATVLTQMPAGSYTISDNADGTSTLTITDVGRFWSVSNFLVVRY
jgi:predicted RNase H-like nuclease (RuvC/YqgF family)